MRIATDLSQGRRRSNATILEGNGYMKSYTAVKKSRF